MKRLMIHVERAVRPIRGETSTKCRMREELFDHITEVYQEELERGGDEDTAIQRACARFGDPAALTTELQATVPKLERIAYPMDEIVRRRSGETPVRHAVRLAAMNTLFYMALCCISLAVLWLLGVMAVGTVARGTPIGFSRTMMHAVLPLCVWMSVGIGLFALIGQAMRDQLTAGLMQPRSWWTAGVLSLLAAAIVLTCGGGYLLTMPIDAATVDLLIPRWILAALATPLLFAILARLAAVDAVRSRPWTSLVIEE